METYYTVSEVADRLNVSLKWVYTHAKKLNGRQIGGKWFFSESGLVKALGENPQDKPEKKQTETATSKRAASREKAISKHGLAEFLQ